MPELARCGRPTKAGLPCRSLLSGPACAAHLTADERRRIAEHQRIMGQRKALHRRMRFGEPACWSWPVTELHLARSGLAQAKGDEGADELAALLLEWQDGRCGLCGSRRGRQVMDHSHKSSLIRGRLCIGCNIYEGKAPDVDEVWGYRRRPPSLALSNQSPGVTSPRSGFERTAIAPAVGQLAESTEKQRSSSLPNGCWGPSS